MGFFSSKPKEEKLPAGAFRGVVNGKRQNYLLRYECPTCGGLFRTESALAACTHRGS